MLDVEIPLHGGRRGTGRVGPGRMRAKSEQREEPLVTSSSQGDRGQDSFGSKDTLEVGGRRTRSTGWTRSRAAERPAVLAEDPAGEPAAHRGRRATSPPTTSARWPAGTRRPSPTPRSSSPPPASSCRTSPACRASSTSPPCARRCQELGGDPLEDQPAGAGRAGHRPLGHRRPVRRTGLVRAQRRAGVRAQPRALPVPALGPDGVRRLQGRAARHRHRAPGQHRVPRPRRVRSGDGGRPTPTPASAPTRTPRWSTASACSAGASAASRPRRPCSASRCRMLIPQVVGFKLTGELPEGATATDLVLTITEMLRKHGVVGKFVEFYGDGVSAVPLANRATIGNMSPEYGSTVAIFPIDDETLRYLRFTGRADAAGRARRGLRQGAGPVARPGRRARLQRDHRARPLDRRPVDRRAEAPAGPGVAHRRQGRLPRRRWPTTPARRPARARRDRRGVRGVLPGQRPAGRTTAPTARRTPHPAPATTATSGRPRNPATVTLRRPARSRSTTAPSSIAAITSCTNTSNPSVMIGAALLAKNAVERGLQRKPWVKTTLAPGLQGRHGLLRAGRPHALPGQARLQPRRLRLHHLHRQLRPAARAESARRSTTTTSRSSRCCPATATSRAGSTPTSR